jgi:hypothetical protein
MQVGSIIVLRDDNGFEQPIMITELEPHPSRTEHVVVRLADGERLSLALSEYGGGGAGWMYASVHEAPLDQPYRHWGWKLVA